MSMQDEITKGIGAHGMWKNRLHSAIHSGRSDFAPEKVETDNQCDFGKWLYSLSPTEQTSDQCRKIQALHAAFHKEAARVLRIALSGDKAGAEKLMAPGGTYVNVSSELTAAMMKWKTLVGV